MHSTSKLKMSLLFIIFFTSFLQGMDNFDTERQIRNGNTSKSVLLLSCVIGGIHFFTQVLNPILYHQPEPASVQQPKFANLLQATLIGQNNIDKAPLPLLLEKRCISTIRNSNYCYDVKTIPLYRKKKKKKKR